MKRIIVFGLGIFGFELAVELSGKGIEVIAIDKNKDAVQRIKDTCAKAIVGDATEKGLLESIGMDKKTSPSFPLARTFRPAPFSRCISRNWASRRSLSRSPTTITGAS